MHTNVYLLDRSCIQGQSLNLLFVQHFIVFKVGFIYVNIFLHCLLFSQLWLYKLWRRWNLPRLANHTTGIFHLTFIHICFQLEWESVWYSLSAIFFTSHSQFCGPCWAYFGGQLAPTPKGTCGLINAEFSIQKFRPVMRWRALFNRHHPFFVAYNCHVGILKMHVSKIITPRMKTYTLFI